MASSPDYAAAKAGVAEHPLPAGARAVLRWLPTVEPSGAFAGHHDQVHCPPEAVHARVCLWWRDKVVHPGVPVGPPRGGMAPGPESSYSVALPGGGYLWIQGGILQGWRAQSAAGKPLVRADGQEFSPGRYSVLQPYFRRHYDAMTVSALRAALRRSGGGDLSHAELSRILAMIAGAGDPVVCPCSGETMSSSPAPLGLIVPESLLVDAGTLRVLVGEADATEAVATLWRLTSLIWDPVAAGRALAAESVARLAGEPARGWPQAPITEQSVAHIAAQAVRHLGGGVVRSMPAWLLGWVMVAKPVIGAVETHQRTVTAALDASDQVRVARVETQWHAMAAARLLLRQTTAALNRLEYAPGPADQPDSAVDVRDPVASSRPDRSEQPVAGMPLREAIRLAYHCDVRTWFGVVAEHR